MLTRDLLQNLTGKGRNAQKRRPCTISWRETTIQGMPRPSPEIQHQLSSQLAHPRGHDNVDTRYHNRKSDIAVDLGFAARFDEMAADEIGPL